MIGYDLLALLSRGHAYDVHDAWSHERGCRCVVRTLRADRAPDAEAQRLLLHEGRLLARLTHPHLVRAYEVREAPEAMVVLEMLGGATLAALLDDGPLDRPDAVELGLQLGSAVRYLHGQGTLHLDLKPANLIADAGRLKVIDLSIAQPPGRVAPGIGTPGWMSPEQKRGGVVGPPADVWGIGMVLAEAAGDALATLTEACLRADPRRRPTVEDVLAELEEAGGVERAERRWAGRPGNGGEPDTSMPEPREDTGAQPIENAAVAWPLGRLPQAAFRAKV